jgi:hypothetical protein
MRVIRARPGGFQRPVLFLVATVRWSKEAAEPVGIVAFGANMPPSSKVRQAIAGTPAQFWDPPFRA